MTKRVALYLRVSTDQQTTENQRLELERWADHRGYEIVATYDDNGVSGSKGRDHRKQFDEMLKAAVRGEFDMVAAWSVDRLGRSLKDLVAFLEELHGAGVDLFLHQQALDTSTAAGKALFGMLGVFSEFERSMIQERVRAGLERAKQKGKTLGRPKLSKGVHDRVLAAHADGLSIRKTAALVGVSVGTAHNIVKAGLSSHPMEK